MIYVKYDIDFDPYGSYPFIYDVFVSVSISRCHRWVLHGPKRIRDYDDSVLASFSRPRNHVLR